MTIRDTTVLCVDIAVLLAKDAIKPVPPAEMKQGFYSPYFIVPNKKQWSSANPGSVSLESGPSQASIQDVDTDVHP